LVSSTSWVPEAGDIIWINLDPQIGHEQAGHRPALVLSPSSYNGLTGLLLCVPLTTRPKGCRFEVPVSSNRAGVALANQVNSFDWRARAARKQGSAKAEEVEAVRARVRVLVG
jgi:mRNA interferase MazF